jgi:hypothetical protein
MVVMVVSIAFHFGGGTSILGPILPTADKLVARLVDWVLCPVAPVAVAVFVVVDLRYCYYHSHSYDFESTATESLVLDAMLQLSRSLPDFRLDCCYSTTIAT